MFCVFVELPMESLYMPSITEPLTGSPGSNLRAVNEPRGDHCRAMYELTRIQFVVKRETET